jgi:hypothetical protein
MQSSLSQSEVLAGPISSAPLAIPDWIADDETRWRRDYAKNVVALVRRTAMRAWAGHAE